MVCSLSHQFTFLGVKFAGSKAILIVVRIHKIATWMRIFFPIQKDLLSYKKTFSVKHIDICTPAITVPI